MRRIRPLPNLSVWQDHFLRNLNVSLPGMARKKPVSTRPEKVVPIDAKDPSAEEVAKKLTLAQKMGLVPMPPAKLSHEEWQQVAAQSRQDFGKKFFISET